MKTTPFCTVCCTNYDLAGWRELPVIGMGTFGTTTNGVKLAKHLRRGVCVTDGTKVWEVTGLERHPTGSGGVGLRAALRLELPLPAIGVVLRIVGSES